MNNPENLSCRNKKDETKDIDQEHKKVLCTILKYFTKQETKLLNFMMIIL